MTTLLVTHLEGASLITLRKDEGETTTVANTVQLPLPSRYPGKTTPQTAVAPSGHIFLWSSAGDIVWEYDIKGRRVGEIATKHAGINGVLGLGKVEGRECAVISDGSRWGIWIKASAGKWEKKRALEVRITLDITHPGLILVCRADGISAQWRRPGHRGQSRFELGSGTVHQRRGASRSRQADPYVPASSSGHERQGKCPSLPLSCDSLTHQAPGRIVFASSPPPKVIVTAGTRAIELSSGADGRVMPAIVVHEDVVTLVDVGVFRQDDKAALAVAVLLNDSGVVTLLDVDNHR